MLAGFLIALICAAPLSVQADISDKLTRLHVVANSDSSQDQQLKLKVRDAVLKASAGYESVTSELLEKMEQAAIQCVRDQGFDYDVTVTMGEMWFDTREYDGFSLAAGNYSAVQVRIGKAQGKNWWCVIFPPLCAAVSEAELTAAAKSAGLSGREIAFISGDGSVCVLGFRVAELWGKLLKGVEKIK